MSLAGARSGVSANWIQKSLDRFASNRCWTAGEILSAARSGTSVATAGWGLAVEGVLASAGATPTVVATRAPTATRAIGALLADMRLCILASGVQARPSGSATTGPRAWCLDTAWRGWAKRATKVRDPPLRIERAGMKPADRGVGDGMDFNQQIIDTFRANNGHVDNPPFGDGLVLVHVPRKDGTIRVAPLAGLRQGGAYHVVGSAGG